MIQSEVVHIKRVANQAPRNSRINPTHQHKMALSSRFFFLLALALCAILLAAQQVEGVRQLRGADIERTVVNCKTFGEELICSM